MSSPSIREMLEAEDTPPDEPTKETPPKEGEIEKKETEEPEVEVLKETKEDKTDEDEGELEPPKDKPLSLISRIKKEEGGKQFLTKYPELQDAYFLKREYEQVFASPKDAAEANERLEYVSGILNPLMDGKIDPLLTEINERDPEAVALLIHNFLPTIAEKSPQMYRNIAGTIVQNALSSAAKAAEKNGNEDLLLAVRYLNKHWFNDEGVPKSKELKSLSRRNEDVEQERAGVQQERREAFFEAVGDRVDPDMEAEINRGLDPDNALTPGLRKTIVERIRKETLYELKKNQEHMKIMGSLAKSAAANSYGKEHRNKVVKQVMSAAREVIPEVRRRIKKEILGDKYGGSEEQEDTPAVPHGKVDRVNNADLPFDPAQIDFSKTNLRDALDFDPKTVTMKK